MTAPVSLIRSTALSDVAQYAYASTAAAGTRLVFLAGACPLGRDGSTLGIGDFAEQARVSMRNLGLALEAAGAGLDNVLFTRVLVVSTRREDLVTAWDVVRGAFGDHDAPSTLMGVTMLGYPGQIVEIEAVAAVRG